MKHLLILSVFLFGGSAALFGDTVSISPASQSVTAGQNFTVDVDIDNIPDVYDFQFSLSFDPAVLAAQSISEGALFAGTNASFFSAGSIDNNAGSISLTYDTLFGTTGVSGPGTLAVVQFTAIGAGTSSIDVAPLGDLVLNDSAGNMLDVDAVSGSVTVAGVAVLPEPGTAAMIAPGVMLIALGVWRKRAWLLR